MIADEMTPAVSFQKVARHFGAVKAVDALDLDIAAGEAAEAKAAADAAAKAADQVTEAAATDAVDGSGAVEAEPAKTRRHLRQTRIRRKARRLLPRPSPQRLRYTPTSAVGQRFQANVQPYNAVSVSVRKVGTMYFGGAFMSPPIISNNAIASVTPQAAFSVGSRLASVDTSKSPLLNAVLGGLLGTNVALNVMDYNSLLSADVNVLSFLDQLAIKLNLNAVSYSDVLGSEATIGQILSALASVPRPQGRRAYRTR